jgi:hypothetical protein
MRIRKTLITLEPFMKSWKLKYKLRNYTPDSDINEPLVVFGCYTKTAVEWVMKHKGLCIIVWSGSDAVNLKQWKYFSHFLRENKHRYIHIAYSHWIKSDLDSVGLEYIEKPIFPVEFNWLKFEDFQGDKIYHYTASQKARQFIYGTSAIKNWQKRNQLLQNHIIMAHCYHMKKPELYETYKRCYMGIRLTEHDNMALSCVEMALMGRPSIFNGNIPGAINYTDNEEAKHLLLKYYKDRPEPSKELAEEMREFIHDDEKWLNTEYYD